MSWEDGMKWLLENYPFPDFKSPKKEDKKKWQQLSGLPVKVSMP